MSTTDDEFDLDCVSPSPELSPRDVVKIQVEALRKNEEMGDDSGIAIVYRFASPANREATGPLERFVRMLKNPLYQPMLDHVTSRFGPTSLEGDNARVQVVLFGRNGEIAAYNFTLSRGHDDCWYTDSVMLVPVDLA